MAGNSNSGRPRKPSAKLRLHGTYREDRHGGRFDDAALPADVVKPDGMSDVASRFWDEVVPQLVGAGFAKRLDGAELRGMCEWWADWLTGSTIGERSTAWRNFAAVAGRFGMTPADRAKLIAEPPKDDGGFADQLQKMGG